MRTSITFMIDLPGPPLITIFWQGPKGRVLVGITHTKNHARGHDRLEIRALDPVNARLPVAGSAVHEGIYRAADIRKAGGPAHFVERFLLDAARSFAGRGAPPGQPLRAAVRRHASKPQDNALHSHPLEGELLKSETYKLDWNSPAGPVTITVTHTKTFFSRAHVVGIEIPPNTPFPLDTLSYLVTDPEIARAGSAKAFVESLIAAAENTARWRDHARRVAQSDLFGAIPSSNPPRRPKPKRPRLKLPAPRR